MALSADPGSLAPAPKGKNFSFTTTTPFGVKTGIPGLPKFFDTKPPAPPSPFDQLDALNQLMAQAYQAGSPAYTVGGGSSIVQTGPSLDQIMGLLGLNNFTPPTLADLQKQASAQTDLSLNPQIAGVQNLINQLNSSTANQLSGENALGARQKSDIQDTFDRLKAFTDASTAAGLQRYNNALASVQSGNQQTSNALDRNFANAQTATNNELSRLGLSGKGSTLDNTKLTQDAAFLQGLAEANANNQQNNLQQQQANYQGVQNLLSQGQQQAGASALTQAANRIADTIAGIKAQQASGLQGFNNQLQTLESSRAAQNAANLAALQAAAQQQLENQQRMILDAIQAAASGQKVVSRGSTHVGASPAQGISPQQAFENRLKILGLQGTQDKTASSATQANNNFNLSLINTLRNLPGSGDTINSILQQMGVPIGQ